MRLSPRICLTVLRQTFSTVRRRSAWTKPMPRELTAAAWRDGPLTPRRRRMKSVLAIAFVVFLAWLRWPPLPWDPTLGMAATGKTLAVLQPLLRSRTGRLGSPRDGSSQGRQAAPAPEAEQAGLAQSMPRISAGNRRATPPGNSGSSRHGHLPSEDTCRVLDLKRIHLS
jgi:hypothetical protein